MVFANRLTDSPSRDRRAVNDSVMMLENQNLTAFVARIDSLA